LDGQFSDSRDTFNFDNNSVSFDIFSNGGLIYPMEGHGTFTVVSDILTIKTCSSTNEAHPREESRALGDREIIEGRTVVFIINNFVPDSLTLTLIGIIDNSEFHKQKTIRKFRKENNKFKFRERQLNKNKLMPTPNK